MSEDRRIERARARPVADAPVAALLERGEELARRWAIALILERPLAEMAEVPLEDLAREAPAVCAQVVRALDSDAELERIAASEGARGGAGAAPTVRLGTHDARATVEHIEALRGVIWEAMLAELDDPPVRQVADLSDRLAFVCATLLAAVFGEGAAASAHEPPREASAQGHGQVLYTAPQPMPGRRGAALIDEFEDAVAQPHVRRERAEGVDGCAPQAARAPGETSGERRASTAADSAAPRAAASGAPRTAPRPLPWDTPLQPRDTPRRTREDRRGAGQRGASGGRLASDADDVVRITRTRPPDRPFDERA